MTIAYEIADVVVIGGGPAGSATALQLARAGVHVVQLERRAFGALDGDPWRSGEALTARTRRTLAALDPDLNAPDWERLPVRQMSCYLPHGSGSVATLDAQKLLIHVDRAALDAALFAAARRAGVDARAGWHVRQFVRSANGAICGVLAQDATGALRQIAAPLVIDAGGRNALALRTFDLRARLPGVSFFAMSLFFDAVAGLADATWEMHVFDPQQLTVMQISRVLPGLVRCGLGTTLAALRDAACDPIRFFWRRLGAAPELAARLRGSTLVTRPYTRAALGYRARRVTHDGLLLVGDAAGYLNPLFGDGVLRALSDAAVAAQIAAAALRSGDCSRRAFAAFERRHTLRSARDCVAAAALALPYRLPGALDVFSHTGGLPGALLSALLR